jgi:large subunit ribosomal protein L23|tara:strand:+ start:15 stop:311 length:297 start_codon:yes stop_codon:yes gene_type:complete
MHNEKLFTLIKAPLVTEKSARVGESLKQIVFKVDLSANKREIKKAVEELFKVEVTKVTTSIVKGKRKRNRYGIYKKSNYKKAFVSLSKDSDIQFEGLN